MWSVGGHTGGWEGGSGRVEVETGGWEMGRRGMGRRGWDGGEREGEGRQVNSRRARKKKIRLAVCDPAARKVPAVLFSMKSI